MTPLVVHRGDGLVVNATIQAILEISAKGEDDRWVMPEKHDVNESVTTIEQRAAFGNLNILGLALCCAENRNPHAHHKVWTGSESGEERIILGTVLAAFGVDVAHLRREENS